MSHSPRGFDAFVSPDSPSARIQELERQNALLREANAVLKHALVGVIERYQLERLGGAKTDLRTDRDVYDEGSDRTASPALARPLEDLTTSVIQAVVRRFAEPSPESISRRGGTVAREIERHGRRFDVENILRCIEETSTSGGLLDDQQLRPQHGANTPPSSDGRRFLSKGVSLVNPSIPRGEEMRVKITGSPCIESQEFSPARIE